MAATATQSLNRREVEQLVREVLTQKLRGPRSNSERPAVEPRLAGGPPHPLVVNVSARHMHMSQADLETLFGRGRGGDRRAESARRPGRAGGGDYPSTPGATQPVPAVMDDVPQFRGQVDHLVDERIRIVAGEWGAAAVAKLRLALDGGVGRQQDAVVFGVPRLAAALLSALGFGRRRFDVRPIR